MAKPAAVAKWWEAYLETQGWHKFDWYSDNSGPDIRTAFPPKNYKCDKFAREDGCKIPEFNLVSVFAAAHKLNETQKCVFMLHLKSIVRRNVSGEIESWKLAQANASERLEALLRTLITGCDPFALVKKGGAK